MSVRRGAIGIFTKARVETLSDGLFAIILTLLVLEIRVPHVDDPSSVAALGRALAAMLPKLASWVVSFFTVCVIWVNHHRLFSAWRSITHGLFWWNAALLLWVSLVPFPTALAGDYPANRLAASLYGIVMALMAASFSCMRWYAVRNPAVLAPGVDTARFRSGTLLSVLFGPVLYLAGAASAWAHPLAAFAVYLAIPVYFIFPHATQEGAG
jgi:uncharacterized membrane protein